MSKKNNSLYDITNGEQDDFLQRLNDIIDSGGQLPAEDIESDNTEVEEALAEALMAKNNKKKEGGKCEATPGLKPYFKSNKFTKEENKNEHNSSYIIHVDANNVQDPIPVVEPEKISEPVEVDSDQDNNFEEFFREFSITKDSDKNVNILTFCDGYKTLSVDINALDIDNKNLDEVSNGSSVDYSLVTLSEILPNFYPTAIFTRKEFEDKFNIIKVYESERFRFYEYNDLIFAYYISENSMNEYNDMVDSLIASNHLHS